MCETWRNWTPAPTLLYLWTRGVLKLHLNDFTLIYPPVSATEKMTQQFNVRKLPLHDAWVPDWSGSMLVICYLPSFDLTWHFSCTFHRRLKVYKMKGMKQAPHFFRFAEFYNPAFIDQNAWYISDYFLFFIRVLTLLTPIISIFYPDISSAFCNSWNPINFKTALRFCEKQQMKLCPNLSPSHILSMAVAVRGNFTLQCVMKISIEASVSSPKIGSHSSNHPNNLPDNSRAFTTLRNHNTIMF